jgi:hypothetical protein
MKNLLTKNEIKGVLKMSQINTQEKKFKVTDNGGRKIDIVDSLSEAVLIAASHDGYGAMYARDEDGSMCLYSTDRHWGNNVCEKSDCTPFHPDSDLTNDEAAIEDVANKINNSGLMHSRYTMGIEKLIFENGVLIEADNTTVAESYAECCDPEETTIDEWRACLLK